MSEKGHVVSEKRLLVDSTKVLDLLYWGHPMTPTDVYSFIVWLVITGDSSRDSQRYLR